MCQLPYSQCEFCVCKHSWLTSPTASNTATADTVSITVRATNQGITDAWIVGHQGYFGKEPICFLCGRLWDKNSICTIWSFFIWHLTPSTPK